MNEDQERLIKWFRKNGKNYDGCIQDLLDTRAIDAQVDKDMDAIYKIFVYLEDDEWEAVKSIVVDL